MSSRGAASGLGCLLAGLASQVRSLGFSFSLLTAPAPGARPCKAQAVVVSVLRHPLALLCLPLCGARLLRVPCPSPDRPLRNSKAVQLRDFLVHRWASYACPRRGLPPGKGRRTCLQQSMNGHPCPASPACISRAATKGPAMRRWCRLSVRPTRSPCYALPRHFPFCSAPFPAMASPFEVRLGLLKCAARLGSTLHRRLPLSLRRLPPCYVLPIATGPAPVFPSHALFSNSAVLPSNWPCVRSIPLSLPSGSLRVPPPSALRTDLLPA